ncbi:MAG: AAA family ATPase [Nanoarchaeota archaeon]
MKLKRLSLKNIRSYKNIDMIFPNGSTLLSGDIGSGKTSILLAIEYSLFGLQPGQRGSSLLRNGANSGAVSLEMDVDGKNIIIERRLKRNHKSVTNEYASISVEGEKSEASLTEIKTKILEYIGYPKELIKKNNLLYRYTVYTPQEQMKQIILEDPETRLNILRYILGVDKYKRIRENLIILLNYLKEETKVFHGEIKNLDDEKSIVELKKTSVKNIEQEVDQKKEYLEIKINKRKIVESEMLQLENKIKEKEYLEKEAEKTSIMVSHKYENHASMESDFAELKKTLIEGGESYDDEEYRGIISKIEEKNKVLDNLNSAYTNLLGEINSLEKRRDETLNKRERVFKIDICPTCLQDVSDMHKHNILNETENLLSKTKQKIEMLEKDILIITKTIWSIKSEKSLFEEKKALKEILKSKTEYLEKAKKRYQQTGRLLESLKNDIELLEKNFKVLKDKIAELSKFDMSIKYKKTELQQAMQEEKNAEINLAEIKRELVLTKREIFEREENIMKKEKIRKTLSYYLELYSWLSSDFLSFVEFTERNVLLKLRQEFSKIFSKWFDMLVPQGSLGVKLDESFSPIIIYKDIEMEYEFLSGGERTAVALAYRLALNQIINSISSKIKTKDIVILDEPTDGFSEMQLDKMRQVLQELNVFQLIIVSHEQKMESFVDNIMKVRKSGDISYFEDSNQKFAGTILKNDGLEKETELNQSVIELSEKLK